MKKMINIKKYGMLALSAILFYCCNGSDGQENEIKIQKSVYLDTLNVKLFKNINNQIHSDTCNQVFELTIDNLHNEFQLGCFNSLYPIPILHSDKQLTFTPVIKTIKNTILLAGYDTYMEIYIFKEDSLKLNLVNNMFCTNYCVWFNEEAKEITFLSEETPVESQENPFLTSKLFLRYDLESAKVIDSLLITDDKLYYNGDDSTESLEIMIYIESLMN